MNTRKKEMDMVEAHVQNPSSWEAEASLYPKSEPARVIGGDPYHLGLNRSSCRSSFRR